MTASGVAARELAAQALLRIEREGAYANIVLPAMLAASDLDQRDRAFVTELVYGTVRMQRACDWLVDRFALRDLDAVARTYLRLGSYQLAYLDTPPHAAVSATVGAAPRKLRGLVNAVLRRVAETEVAAGDWPDDATRLSYPQWILDALTRDLGADDAQAALVAMNESASVTERDDSYIQDRASQWVVDAVGAARGERVLDVCAAPGGKATGMASSGAFVVAADRRVGRVGLIVDNVQRLALTATVAPVVVDGEQPPFRPRSFDRILVDAPCSGLGALRRRPDARWRIMPDDVVRLADVQRRLVDAAVPLLRPGGTLVYSACTLTADETVGIDDHLAATHPGLVAVDPPADPWRRAGRGARILPQDAGTDGMFVLVLRAHG